MQGNIKNHTGSEYVTLRKLDRAVTPFSLYNWCCQAVWLVTEELHVTRWYRHPYRTINTSYRSRRSWSCMLKIGKRLSKGWRKGCWWLRKGDNSATSVIVFKAQYFQKHFWHWLVLIVGPSCLGNHLIGGHYICHTDQCFKVTTKKCFL